MKLLVTGGAGFIGSNFIKYVLKNRPEWEIVNLDLLTYAGNLENLKEIEDHINYRFVRGDISDNKIVFELVKECDAIVNFAAESHVDRSILDSTAFIKTNVLGTQVLLEAARLYGGKRFHHISTDEVYGSLGLNDPPFDESTPYNPHSPYAASKAASDHLVRAYFHTYRLPITISNCSNNYGPYQFPEKLHALFITNLIEGKKVPLYGDGLQIRDWIYVLDHCEAVLLVLERGKIGETYCIGGNCEKTNLEITKKILEIMKMGEDMIAKVKDRPGHDRRYAIDFSKIRHELGWEPKTSFNQGMEETVKWYQLNKSWWQNVKNGSYQEYYARQYGEIK